MHVAGLVDLGHGRVHQGVAGTAFAPRAEQTVCPLATFPGNGVVLGLVSTLGHMGEIGQYLHIKVAPDQLTQPHRSAAAAVHLLLQCGCRQAAD